MRLHSKKMFVASQVRSPKSKKPRTKKGGTRTGETRVPDLTALLKQAWKGAPEKKELEYIGSPRMRQRLKAGSRLSVRIDGNHGAYRTSLKGEGGKQLTYSCTCPSPYYPCKHAAALAYTYLKEPETFFDVNTLEPRLEQLEKAELANLLLTCLTEYPKLLMVLGFVAQEEEDEEWEDEDEEWEEDEEEDWGEEEEDDWEDEE